MRGSLIGRSAKVVGKSTGGEVSSCFGYTGGSSDSSDAIRERFVSIYLVDDTRDCATYKGQPAGNGGMKVVQL